jgi:hypothetical protein
VPNRFLSRLSHRVAALVVLLAAIPQANAVIDASYSGSYFNPDKSGFGVDVEMINANEAAFAWYTYDNNGNQAWVIGVGTVNQATSSISGNAFITKGMVFGTFAPAPTVEAWGTLTLTFTGCNTGILSWTSNYNSGGRTFTDGSQPIGRLTSLGHTPCGPAAGIYTTGTGFIGPVVAYAIVDKTGKMTLFQGNLNALYEGNFVVAGTSNAFTFQGNAVAAAGIEFNGDSKTSTFNGQGTFTRFDSLNATYSGSNVTNNKFSLPYDARTNRVASLAGLAGDYLITLKGSEKIKISATGVITNSENDNCDVGGTVTVPDATINIYQVTLIITDCSNVSGQNLNGTYTGPGTVLDLADYGDRKTFLVATRNAEAAMIRGLNRYTPTP